MPRGPIEYKTFKEGAAKPMLPSLFGRGRRESIVAMLSIAGPMFWHEVCRSADLSEISGVRRELGPLLDAELVLTSIRRGRRRSVSLNVAHPWYKDLAGFGRALSRVSMPQILLTANAERPEPLENIVLPERASAAALFGSLSKATLLVALKKHAASSPSFLGQCTGISLVHVEELLRSLSDDGVVAKFGPIFGFNKRWTAYSSLVRLLGKVTDVVDSDGTPRWIAPVVIGSEIRTKLIALLAANGPSRYHNLTPTLRTTNEGVYAAALRLIGLGVVRTARLVEGDQQLSFYELDPAYPAYEELLALGKAIASGTNAPKWKEEGKFARRPFPTSKRHRNGWLFKRHRKMTILLLVHAAGAIREEAVAKALAFTHNQTLFSARHLMNDGLIVMKKEGRYNVFRPNADNPYEAEISALLRRLLKVQFPDIAALAKAVSLAPKRRRLT